MSEGFHLTNRQTVGNMLELLRWVPMVYQGPSMIFMLPEAAGESKPTIVTSCEYHFHSTVPVVEASNLNSAFTPTPEDGRLIL